LSSKREAINYALRLVAGEVLDVEQARALRGTGWEGVLDEKRSSRSV
jgi:Arc/MetJ family transcription regulator